MMTRKDYLRAASIVRDLGRRGKVPTEVAEGARDLMRDAFVTFFRGDNPRFDADRFREACEKD